jgi:tetratricopeptide (TPR) repeat protein
MRAAVLLSSIVLLSACSAQRAADTPRAQGAASAAASVAMSPRGARYPLTLADYRTTDAAIYMGNVDAHIEGLRSTWARTRNAEHQAALGGALLQRFRILGRLDDAEEALALLAAAASAQPHNPQTAVLHASALAAFHRFDEARGEIGRATAMTPRDEFLRRTTREIDLALGAYDRLGELFAAAAMPVADFHELALHADIRAMQGDLAGASHLLLAAQSLYVDVDPFQLAWLHTQQGIVLLRFGEVARAREFFAAAAERLPQYYLAVEHLAETEFLLGNLDAARERYRAVIEQTGNPEFWAALAEVESKAGRATEAAAAQARARAGYDALLARHRAAYLQHAAEFHLDLGEHEIALDLAEENLRIRSDVSSQILLADAAHAAGARDRACEAVRRVAATQLAPPEFAASPARADCAP